MSTGNIPRQDPRQGVYRVGEFRVDLANHRLYRGAELVSDDERTIQLLALLIQEYPRTVHKNDLLEAVWPRVVVSEWSLSKLVSDTRALLGDSGDEQHLIRTVRGSGFKLLVEPHLEAPASAGEAHGDAVMAPVPEATVPAHTRTWSRVMLAGLTVAVLATVFVAQWLWQGPQQSSRTPPPALAVTLDESLRRIHALQEMSLTAFKAQVSRRNELVQLLERRLGIERKEQYEIFFAKHFAELNTHERFVFDQIRGLTTGLLHQANRGMLDELERNPAVLQATPSMPMLRQHLLFWLGKYESVFLKRPDMCVLYAGVEDGVPYPTAVDQEVVDWLATKRTADN